MRSSRSSQHPRIATPSSADTSSQCRRPSSWSRRALVRFSSLRSFNARTTTFRVVCLKEIDSWANGQVPTGRFGSTTVPSSARLRGGSSSWLVSSDFICTYCEIRWSMRRTRTGGSTATDSRPARTVERPATTRAITATSFVRTANMSGATTGTAASSLACGPVARSAGRQSTRRHGGAAGVIPQGRVALQGARIVRRTHHGCGSVMLRPRPPRIGPPRRRRAVAPAVWEHFDPCARACGYGTGYASSAPNDRLVPQGCDTVAQRPSRRATLAGLEPAIADDRRLLLIAAPIGFRPP